MDQDAPEGESQAERMRREFEEERQRLQEQRKKGGHTAQRAANVSALLAQSAVAVKAQCPKSVQPLTCALAGFLGVLGSQICRFTPTTL